MASYCAGWPSGSGAAVAGQAGGAPGLGLADEPEGVLLVERGNVPEEGVKAQHQLAPLLLASRCSMGWRRASGNWAGQALRGLSSQWSGRLHHIGQGDQPLTTRGRYPGGRTGAPGWRSEMALSAVDDMNHGTLSLLSNCRRARILQIQRWQTKFH